MSRPSPVAAVGVVVPARDEQDRVQECLRSVLAALAAVTPRMQVAACVVLDGCRDGTARAVARAADASGGVLDAVVNEEPRTVGELRTQGMVHLLRRLPGEYTWLLSTDADTRVPVSWVRDHLRHADAGADAVAGVVELDDPRALPADVLSRYTGLVAAGLDGDVHTHAYAANLGVRAAPFLDVGGFPVVSAGEEHALLHRLRIRGYVVRAPADVTARTSARTTGRAQGGLADLLQQLHRGGPPAPGPTGPDGRVARRDELVTGARFPTVARGGRMSAMSGTERTSADDSSDGPGRLESTAGAFVLEVVDDTAILTATGDLDLALAPKLHQMVDRAARLRPRLVVIDLSGLGFLASAGMSELVRAHRAQPARTELRIVADGRLVLRPLQLTRLIDELAVFPTLRAALTAP